MDNGRYPTTEQGLAALIAKPAAPPEPKNWKGPYIESTDLPKDPWGADYIYRNPGERNPNGYDLRSLGPDGQDGGEDDIEKP